MIEDDDDMENVVVPCPDHRITCDTSGTVAFDILRSSSYQVPILYLSLSGLPVGLSGQSHEVLKTIIPILLQPQMQGVGVMGGVTVTVGRSAFDPTYEY